MIRQIRKHVTRSPWFVLSLVTVFLVTSCTPDTISNNSGFSGEDYVRGIFLGSGPVAKRIPEISSKFNHEDFLKTDEERMQLEVVHNQILSALDPAFIESFKRDMESGNHLRIQAALKNGAVTIKNAMFSEKGPLQHLTPTQKNELMQFTGKQMREKYFSKEDLDKTLQSFRENSVIVPVMLSDRTAQNVKVAEACVTTVLAITAVIVVVGAVAVWLFVVEGEAFWIDIGVQVEDEVVSEEPASIARMKTGTLYQEQVVNSIAVAFAQ
jgi:hypothetical protein